VEKKNGHFGMKNQKHSKCKCFSKRIVENHVGNVDKKRDVFPQKCVEKKKFCGISLFGN